MALNKGDIVLVQFPFTDLSQTKLRPAVVLLENTSLNEVTLCFISSQNIENISSEEFILSTSDAEFIETGLRVASKVRVTRIVTLQRQLIIRRLGKLGVKQIQILNAIMLQAFQLI
ncbi:type II toxin-antitoxin system PemK/MazF family toxin [Hassallia byssoidea VB512170]|uniref:Type II toxin-antitoxin system PemK/MazF family toxin n=1 Tax=Hassallia byssoidea VB512170 TaxID=1304833 RepID=A0A846HHY6_9CYAN|nr:type II toxin-antitoxin system PemK/MazF family toxin [Hassalia byssoidea VB512170]